MVVVGITWVDGRINLQVTLSKSVLYISVAPSLTAQRLNLVTRVSARLVIHGHLRNFSDLKNFIGFQKFQNQNVFQNIVSNFDFWNATLNAKFVARDSYPHTCKN